jgi:hypothetical protein
VTEKVGGWVGGCVGGQVRAGVRACERGWVRACGSGCVHESGIYINKPAAHHRHCPPQCCLFFVCWKVYPRHLVVTAPTTQAVAAAAAAGLQIGSKWGQGRHLGMITTLQLWHRPQICCWLFCLPVAGVPPQPCGDCAHYPGNGSSSCSRPGSAGCPGAFCGDGSVHSRQQQPYYSGRATQHFR